MSCVGVHVTHAECSPAEAAICDSYLVCTKGTEGYVCDDGRLTDVAERTTVTTWANMYDEKTLTSGGCDPAGCTPELTRDSDLDPSSRWSCKYGVGNTPCQLWFEFEEPQDIVEFEMAFYKGNERTRAFTVTTFNADDDTEITDEFTSSGGTLDYDIFFLGSDQTYKLVITPDDPNYYDWLSITEVGRPYQGPLSENVFRRDFERSIYV